MLIVTPAAREFFARLLTEQPEDTHLRLRAVEPGTPRADCELTYCQAAETGAGDEAVDCGRFTLFVDGNSRPWLEGATLDFETDATGGELSIKAPGLKGQRPDDGASLHEKVSWVLEARINPMVASHGGHVALVDVTDDGMVVLQFGGGCHGCGMVDVTLKQGVETTLKQEIPEIAGVRDATDHSTGENPYYAP